MLAKVDMKTLFVLVAFLLSSGALPAETQAPPDRLPEAVLYWQMFRHAIALDKRADEMDRRGEDGSKLRRFYRDKAGLDESQAGLLDKIANECASEVAAQDRRAMEVIRAFRARFPNGRLSGGQTPPPAPPELAALQQERDAIVLKFRDRLRTELGESEFERFHTFVQESIAPQIRQITTAARPQPTRSQLPLSGH